MTSYNSLTKIVEYYGRSKTVAPVALSAASPMTRFAVESGEHGCVLPNIRVRCRLDNAELYSKEETMRGYTANFEDNIFLKHSAASQSSLYADDFDTNKEDDLMDIGEGEGTLPSSVDAEKKRDTVSSYTSNKEPVTVTIGDDSCGADQQLHEDFEINDDFVGFCKKKATPETKDLETNTLTETTAPVEKEADATTVEEENDPFASTINDEESPGLYRRITLYGNNTNRLPEILPYSEWWFRRGPVALPVVVIAVGLTGTVHLYEMDLLRYLRSSVQLNCSTISTLLMNDGEETYLMQRRQGEQVPPPDYGPDAFGRCNKIVELVMSECVDLRDTSFLLHFPHLLKLDCSFVQLNANFNDTIQHCKGLRDLLLVFCKGDGTRQLEAVPHFSRLRLLHLSNSNIVALPDQLQACRVLTKIDLSYCRALEDFTPLARVTSLRVLNLGGDSQIDSIDFLETCVQLEVLCVSSCRGIKSVAVCEHLPRLRDLDCSYSSVHHVGALSKCTALQKVDFRTCPLCPAAIEELEKMTNVNYTHVGRRAFSTSASSFNSSTSGEEGEDDDW